MDYAVDKASSTRYSRGMLKRSSTPKRPRDLNQLAANIVEAATADAEPEEEQGAPAQDAPAVPEKNPAAVALGKLGGRRLGQLAPPS